MTVMTGSLNGAVEPLALLGKWQLTRWLRDERAGLSGTVSGQLTLRAEDERIDWHEQGTLLWNGSRRSVSRSYSLRPGKEDEEGWWLYFSDGRSFHPWRPGRWVHHPCSEDSYHGLITIAGPDVWHTLWDVRGPATTQRITTRFVRAADSIGG